MRTVPPHSLACELRPSKPREWLRQGFGAWPPTAGWQYQAVTARWVAGVAQIIEHRAVTEQLPPSLAPSLAAQIVAFLWGTLVELLLGACPMTVLDQTGAQTAAAREYARSGMRRLLDGLEAERNAE